MNVAMIADFDLKGSGYQQIVAGVGTELARRDHKVTVLGMGYRGDEHHFPFGVVPIALGPNVYDVVRVYLRNLKGSELMDHLIVATDVPQHDQLLPTAANLSVPYTGIFPLEAPPCTRTAAFLLMQMAHRYCLSRFGTDELAKCGVEATFLPTPVNTDVYKPIDATTKSEWRVKMGLPLDSKVVLCVADNHERKNLSALLQIIAEVPDVILLLVTRTRLSAGWNLHDLLSDLKIADRVMLIERGAPQSQLQTLYGVSDAFLITSKAEGLGVPVLEAMSCKLPVVAPKHTAFEEHLSDGRGVLFGNAYQYIDPFMNGIRYFADVDDGAKALRYVLLDNPADLTTVTERAYEYVTSRTWENVGDLICQALQ